MLHNYSNIYYCGQVWPSAPGANGLERGFLARVSGDWKNQNQLRGRGSPFQAPRCFGAGMHSSLRASLREPTPTLPLQHQPAPLLAVNMTFVLHHQHDIGLLVYKHNCVFSLWTEFCYWDPTRLQVSVYL